MNRRNILPILAFVIAGIVFGRWAAFGQSPVVQWQNVANLITNLQNQLNAIQAQVTASLLPAGATACQTPVENSTATSIIWSYLTGDISTTSGSCGTGSQVVTVTGFEGVPLLAGAPTANGQAYYWSQTDNKFELGFGILSSNSGPINPITFGAPTGVITAMTGTINGGTAALSLSVGPAPPNGHGLAIPGAGAATLLSTPAAPSVLVNHIQDWLPGFVVPIGYIFKPTVGNAGGYYYQYTTASSVADPTAAAGSEPSWCQTSNGCTTADGSLAVATRCDTCHTTYNFKSVAGDGACGSTIASLASGAVTNATPLGFPNYIEVQQTPVVGAWTYLLYETVSGTAVDFLPASIGDTNAKQEFTYTGQTTTITSPCFSATPPATAINDAFFSTILSGGGTNLVTLVSNATATASGTVYPDDAFAINAAIASLNTATGGVIQMNPQTFIVSQPIVMGLPGGGIVEPQLIGFGGAIPYLLTSPMMQGLPVIKSSNNFKPRIANLTIAASQANAAPRAGIEFNINNPDPPSGYVGEATVENVAMDAANPPQDCIEFTAAVGYDQNNSENRIRNLDCLSPHAGIYFGHVNTLQNHIEGGNIQGNDAAILLNGGSFDDVGSVLGGTGVGFFTDWENGTYEHAFALTDLHIESTNGLLRVSADATGISNNPINYMGADVLATGNQDGLFVDYEASSPGALNFTNSNLPVAGTNQAWVDNAAQTNFMADRGMVNSLNGTTYLNVLNATIGSASALTFSNVNNTGINFSLANCTQFPYVTATLPSCSNTGLIQHARAYVTDATACTNGTTYAGSGAVACILTCEASGSAWKETGAGCY